ncbi:hypothetical protein niasHT_013467 [Heterodera trifolii]|uniref:Uncharacterized protein n=1 Tax=Heterodera trifolii TaxID=157864 RepID=A0ABD2LCP3_9BILA
MDKGKERQMSTKGRGRGGDEQQIDRQQMSKSSNRQQLFPSLLRNVRWVGANDFQNALPPPPTGALLSSQFNFLLLFVPFDIKGKSSGGKVKWRKEKGKKRRRERKEKQMAIEEGRRGRGRDLLLLKRTALIVFWNEENGKKKRGKREGRGGKGGREGVENSAQQVEVGK